MFASPLRLQRDERGTHRLTLDTRAAAPEEAIPEPMRVMREELSALLDRVQGSRRVVRHLAAVEHELRRKDASGLSLFELPVEHLKAALRDFDNLAPDAGTGGLVTLRGRLAAAIASHEGRERKAQRQQPISSFLTDEKLQVAEVRQSDFDQANADWMKPVPGSPR